MNINENKKLNSEICNVFDLPVENYNEHELKCIKKISERRYSRSNTFIKKLSDSEILFINGEYKNSTNTSGYSSAKQWNINQIDKFDLYKNKYTKVFVFPDETRKQIIDLNEKFFLIKSKNILSKYDINSNRVNNIIDSFDYNILFSYNQDKLLCVKNGELYSFDINKRKISFLNKLPCPIDKIFKINDRFFLLYSRSQNQKPFLYSLKNNESSVLNLKNTSIQSVDKISDNLLLIMQTNDLREDKSNKDANYDLYHDNNYEDNIIVYDIENNKIIKNIKFRTNAKYREFYKFKKLNNGEFLIYGTNSISFLFNKNLLELKKLNCTYYFGLSDSIENIVDINNNQILINTKKNIYVYTY